MPPLETADLLEYAVLWRNVSVNRYGRAVVSALPLEIRCCWTHVKTEVTDPSGNVIQCDGEVAVDRLIAVGSVLWEGRLDDLPGTGTAAPETDMMTVVKVDYAKDLRARSTRYVVTVARLSDTLPVA